jgi:hypothetical protein
MVNNDHVNGKLKVFLLMIYNELKDLCNGIPIATRLEIKK